MSDFPRESVKLVKRSAQLSGICQIFCPQGIGQTFWRSGYNWSDLSRISEICQNFCWSESDWSNFLLESVKFVKLSV